MSKKESVKKETTKPTNEDQSKPSPELKKPQKRKESKEGVEVKEDGVYFTLTPKKKVCVKKFKSNILIDIREYFEKNGQTLPTKKGISLNLDCWKKLKEYSEEIDEAIDNA